MSAQYVGRREWRYLRAEGRAPDLSTEQKLREESAPSTRTGPASSQVLSPPLGRNA